MAVGAGAGAGPGGGPPMSPAATAYFGPGGGSRVTAAQDAISDIPTRGMNRGQRARIRTAHNSLGSALTAPSYNAAGNAVYRANRALRGIYGPRLRAGQNRGLDAAYQATGGLYPPI